MMYLYYFLLLFFSHGSNRKDHVPIFKGAFFFRFFSCIFNDKTLKL